MQPFGAGAQVRRQRLSVCQGEFPWAEAKAIPTRSMVIVAARKRRCQPGLQFEYQGASSPVESDQRTAYKDMATFLESGP